VWHSTKHASSQVGNPDVSPFSHEVVGFEYVSSSDSQEKEEEAANK